MADLVEVHSVKDIPAEYRVAPIEHLFRYHNLGEPFAEYTSAQLLVGMCMDNRKQLRIPENFAYIIRSGGGNLRYSEFKVAYAVAIGRLSTIAIITHNSCGMVNMISRKKAFVDGLVEAAGWTADRAEEYFMRNAPVYEIGNEIDFVLSETKRIRVLYPKVTVVPLFYRLEDNRLCCVKEDS